MPARRAVVLASLPLLLTVTSCGSNNPADTGVSDGYLVRAINGSCESDQRVFRAGPITFDVHNLGEETSGFTVYARGSSAAFDRPLEEKPALATISQRNTQTVTVQLSAGTYELSCAPEQGAGPRTQIEATPTGPIKPTEPTVPEATPTGPIKPTEPTVPEATPITTPTTTPTA